MMACKSAMLLAKKNKEKETYKKVAVTAIALIAGYHTP
jgi:hypothetical protein